MKTTKEFCPSSRYFYDSRMCTTTNGFAQIDTSQDASYYGNWCNPFKRIIFTYCEGDCYTKIAENDDEFIKEIIEMKKWNEENGHRFMGIDPGFNTELEEKFKEIGLGNLLH